LAFSTAQWIWTNISEQFFRELPAAFALVDFGPYSLPTI